MVSSENDNPSTSARSNVKCHYRNKYDKWYWTLIEKYEKRDYLPEHYEKHHPVPKSLWPEGWRHREIEATVCVSRREHFILHLLLFKCGFSILGVSRFVLNFSRGKQKGEAYSNSPKFWKSVYDKYNAPHNKGKMQDPLWSEADYFYWVWKNLLPTNTKGTGSGYSGNGYRNLMKATGESKEKTLKNMVTRFRKGWIPEEDPYWLDNVAKI
jgi:hypothetical protein